MATEVKLPRLGQGMESGTIVRWLKAEGDSVKAREPLYELDTDKVTQEVESEVDGVLLEIVVREGETEVGTTIASDRDGRHALGGRRGAATVASTETPSDAELAAGAGSRPEPRERGGTTRMSPTRPPAPGSRPRRSPGASRASAGSS